MSNKQKYVIEGGVVLSGVPKATYGSYGGCTPYPICLKSISDYLGDELDYTFAIVASGAAFRLVWDTTCWNGGNVDVIFTFDDPGMVYRNGVEALGRDCRLLSRMPETTQDEFFAFIKAQIDSGKPCIALGVIGPPEACIIAGYRDGGKTLLGWNCFQQWECKTFDDCGYYITDSWWENKDTKAVISLGDITGPRMPSRQIIQNAISALTGRQDGNYAKGINAYDAWKKAITDDSQFLPDIGSKPSETGMANMLDDRMMCQGDATDCLMDGRGHGKRYFEGLAAENPGQPLFAEIAKQFGLVESGIYTMYEVLGGWQRGEVQCKNLARPETRRKLGDLIDKCKAADECALSLMKELLAQIQ